MFTQGRKYCSFIHRFGHLWGRPYVRLIIPWFLFVKYGTKFKNLTFSWAQLCFSTSLLCYFLRKDIQLHKWYHNIRYMSDLFSLLSFLTIPQYLFQWQRSSMPYLCSVHQHMYLQGGPPRCVALLVGAYIDYNLTLIGRQLIITGYTGPGCVITRL